MNIWSPRCFFLFLICAPIIQTLHAQQAEPGVSIGSTRQDTIPEGITPLDSAVAMTYVLIDDPNKSFTLLDSFSWLDNNDYPVPFHVAHLGNYGSAARTLSPDISAKLGFATGWNQYDVYYSHEPTFKYYGQDVPVTKIKYAQASQDDIHLGLEFGRSFARGLSLSIAYERINQVGEYANQRQKTTGFGVGVWHNAPSGKYDAFYNYTSNAIVAQENGGVSDPDSIGFPAWPDNVIPVYVLTGTTNHKHRHFLTKQIFHLTSDSASFGLDVWLKGKYSTGLFKYVDESAESAANYYGSEYFIDDRGIRQYTYTIENEWSMGVTLPWHKAHSTLNGSVRYRGINLQQEPTEKKINEFYVEADGVFQWVEPLILKGGFKLGLGQAEGVFSYTVDADLDIGSMGHLLGNWSGIARRPYMIESLLYVNQQMVYQTDFQNPFTNEIGVVWDLDKQSFKVGAKWLLYDNYIYFDSLSFPNQVGESFSLRRFFASKSFDFKNFGIEGSIFWQPDPPEKLAIPEWWYTVRAYGKVGIFNSKVILLPGIDMIYNSTFSGIGYFPVNGTYRLTNAESIPDYFRLDVGLGLQINFIKFFVRFEDFIGLFDNRILYQADLYPHYRGYFRVGLEASFFN